MMVSSLMLLVLLLIIAILTATVMLAVGMYLLRHRKEQRGFEVEVKTHAGESPVPRERDMNHG